MGLFADGAAVRQVGDEPFRIVSGHLDGLIRVSTDEICAALGERGITEFNYRNHGSALGRVLAGIQVPPGDDEAFRSYLDTLGYFWVEESDNPAYRLFL